jgi:TonB family protein
MAASDPSKPMPAATQILRGQEPGFEADFADLAARFAAKSGGGLSPELSAELALEIVLNEIVEQGCQITGATGAAIVLDCDGELTCRASSGSTAPELGLRIDRSTGLVGACLRTNKTLWCDDTFTDSRAEGEPMKEAGARSVVIMPLLQGDTLVGIFSLFSTQPYAFGVRDERALETLADRTLINLEHASDPFDSPPDAIGPAADVQEEDMQKIGFQNVGPPNIALQSLDAANPAADDVDVTQVAQHAFPLPERSSPNLNGPKDVLSDSHKTEADSAAPSPSEHDFAFPDFDPAEIKPEDIHALLENAGLIAPAPATPRPALEGKPALPIAPAPATPRPALEGKPALPLHSAIEEPAENERPAEKQLDYITWALGFAVVSVAVLLGLVLGQHFVLSHSHTPVRAASTPNVPATAQKPAQTNPPPAPAPGSTAAAKATRLARPSASRESAATSDQSVPPGGLLVLENGKEVFRLPPEKDQNTASAQQLMRPASELDPESPSQDVVEVPEATAQRELLHRVEPEYPEAARQQAIQGRVALEVHIGTEGSVQDVEVVSGAPVLAQASIDAVKQWKFKPRVLNGRPVEMQTRVTFDFKLPQ